VVKRYYYVVLQNNGTKRAACFSSKKEFDEWYPPFRDIEKIVARGIPAKRALELSDSIDYDSRFAKAIRREIILK